MIIGAYRLLPKLQQKMAATESRETNDKPCTAAVSSRFPGAMRLKTNDVGRVLKSGQAIRARTVEVLGAKAKPVSIIYLKLLAHAAGYEPHMKAGATFMTHGRIAISVPKKLLKSAVARNQVKRWVREAFRQHGVRRAPVDLLLTLSAVVDIKNRAHRTATICAIESVFERARTLATDARHPDV